MNHENHLSAAAITADQAVFTSIRTPTGEGYRIIAASPGVQANERAEITRRAPSHDSLCNADENATGMIAFRVPGGRYCIGFCQYAGREHTGRGGHRVHTHFAILDTDAYSAFGWDATRVYRALAAQVHGQPLLKACNALETLSLEAPTPPRTNGDNGVEIQRGLALLPLVLTGEPVLVCRFDAAADIVALAVAALPKAARPSISMTIGLKFSPSRQTQVNLTSMNMQEAERILRGLRMTCLDWSGLPPFESTVWAPWLNFVQRRYSWGRAEEVAELTATMDEPMNAGQLQRVATLSDDIEAVLIADEARLQMLLGRYINYTPGTPVEQRLLQRFERAAQVRQAALSQTQAYI